MLHRICILTVAVMAVLSIFLVFRPHQQLDGFQPPLGSLAAAECVAHPVTGAHPPEYGCVDFDPARATTSESEKPEEQ
jgi:hypothetical protein